MSSFMLAVRPEIAAGGIARDDGEIHFFVRANALLRPGMTVLDFGCGRGALFDAGEGMLRERLANFKGRAGKVVGVDVDRGIFEHPFLDERHLIAPDDPIPLLAGSVDLIVAHWVFEHIQDPSRMAREFDRILRPGGWICARTPHRWSYVALFARLIPEGWHSALIKKIKPGMKEQDKFPTAYLLNTQGAIKRYFPQPRWLNCSYSMSSTPRYHFGSKLIFSMMAMVHHVFSPKCDLIVLLKKRGEGEA